MSEPSNRPRTVVRRGSDFPSRNCVDLYSPAEKAIAAAVDSVERAGASIALTDAVILLGKAKDRVADHVEGVAESVAGNRRLAPEPLPLTDEHIDKLIQAGFVAVEESGQYPCPLNVEQYDDEGEITPQWNAERIMLRAILRTVENFQRNPRAAVSDSERPTEKP
jgi:hypothetical protein